MKFTITKIAGHSASFEVDKNHKHVKNLLINVDTLLDSEVGGHGHENRDTDMDTDFLKNRDTDMETA